MDEADLERARACEAAEAESIASWFDAAPPAVVRELGCAWARVGGAAAYTAPAVDKVVFNAIVGLGVHEPFRDAHLDEALALFARAGTRRCLAGVVPGPGHARVSEALAARGFTRSGHWLRLVRPASPPPEAATSLDLREIGAADADAFGEMAGEVFGFAGAAATWTAALVGRPGWTVFGTWDGATLAGGAAVFVHGDAAWFGVAATRAAYRGRGSQSAVIAARARAALAAGASLLTVETDEDPEEKPNPSARNLRRLGFRVLYERENWIKVLRPA